MRRLFLTIISLLFCFVSLGCTSNQPIETYHPTIGKVLPLPEDDQEWWDLNNLQSLNSYLLEVRQTRENAKLHLETVKSELLEYYTPKQLQHLHSLSNSIENSSSIPLIEIYKNQANNLYAAALFSKTTQERLAAKLENELQYNQINEIIEESENYIYEEPQYYYEEEYYDYSPSYSGSSSNFKRDGVIYQDGYNYTWYSSNVLHHYRTEEWTAGDDGIYRTDDGYVVVASDDDNYGDIVDTPFGDGIVLDSGSGSGIRDIYTNY